MARPDADKVRRVGIIGSGLIGASWTALFLGQGMEVATYDERDDAEERVREGIDRAGPALAQQGLDASRGTLIVCDTIDEACDGAGFVQESVFENLAVKREILKQVDAATAPDVVIASSSSGLLPTSIAKLCTHPERILVGHPFNPPYLIPLVEVVGGEKTDSRAMDWAMEFYAAVGKRPIRCKKEVPGYVANRLQSAVFREIMHLIKEDVASVEDIDRSISHGPGLRWAVQGPVLTFHQAHDKGMAAFIKNFEPEITAWTDAGRIALEDTERARLIAGAEALAEGKSHRELAAIRDAVVLAPLTAKDEKGGNE
ncbi:MAG: 3-hydroxyacyl-CoA dehydrogenase [Rhodospirillaceae bacterium]|nr:3-hydroxyacyl-CoA dehydrogenase [Rhodospirillaceae bacterium]